jgi:amino acid transporter
MSVADAPEAAAARGNAEDAPTLNAGAVGFVSNIVVGLSSVAPAYSLAATLGFIAALPMMGVHAPAILLASFIPVFGVAYAFKAFNRIEPDCGTSFAWVTRAVGPRNGWLQGWGIFVADIIVMASLSIIAATHTYLLVGADSLADSAFWLVVGAIVWTALMTWIAWRGIELSARVQQLLFVGEVVVILAFAGLAFAHLGEAEGSITPSLEWFNPFALGFGTLTAGVLLGLFIYWGWDTGVSINEETENSAETPGTAAVVSTLILLAIYLVVGTAAQAYAGPEAIADQDVFEALGDPVMGNLVFLLEIAIVLSAAASTQTTIMPSARVALSMARRESIPAKFGEIHPRFLTPSFATIFTGVVACVWTVFLLLISPGQTVLADSVTAVGFAICFYYGGTALAGAWYFRKTAMTSVRRFIELLVLPLSGGVLMFAVFVKALVTYSDPANASGGVFGVGTPVVIGIGGLLLGLPLMLIAQGRYPRFFRNETMPTLESYEQNQG